ncbi:MAG: polysaccharide biosynthesis/export family protein [Bacteroidales bacterium]|nr:polysaccharide biosynthesis/export family protein [Bacteroidales bacterium]
MIKRLFNWALIGAVMLLTASCAVQKHLTYLQDMEYGVPYEVLPMQEIHLQPGDQLSIKVSCKQPELAIPFNIMSGSISTDGAGSTTASSFARDNDFRYTVDQDGCINFPLLGPLMIQGMTIEEVEDFVERRIKEESYISDPIVTANFKNFQITVLGMAGSGNYTIEKDRLNILEAIAMIGTIPNTALIDDIMVIRNQDGFRTAYSVNLKTKDLFESPVYYLQQNDIIYIKPNKYASDGRIERVSRVSNNVFSFLNLISNIFIWRYLFRNSR